MRSFELRYYQDLLYQTALTVSCGAASCRATLWWLASPWATTGSTTPSRRSWAGRVSTTSTSSPGCCRQLSWCSSSCWRAPSGHRCRALGRQVGAAAAVSLLRLVRGRVDGGPLSAITQLLAAQSYHDTGWVFGLAAVGCLTGAAPGARRRPRAQAAPARLRRGCGGGERRPYPSSSAGSGWRRRRACRCLATPFPRRRRGVAPASVRYTVACSCSWFAWSWRSSSSTPVHTACASTRVRGCRFAGPRLRAARSEHAAMGVALAAWLTRRWVIALLPCLGLVFLISRPADRPHGMDRPRHCCRRFGGRAGLLAPGRRRAVLPDHGDAHRVCPSGAGVGLFLVGLTEARTRRRRWSPRPAGRRARRVAASGRRVVVVLSSSSPPWSSRSPDGWSNRAARAPRRSPTERRIPLRRTLWTWLAPAVTVLRPRRCSRAPHGSSLRRSRQRHCRLLRRPHRFGCVYRRHSCAARRGGSGCRPRPPEGPVGRERPCAPACGHPRPFKSGSISDATPSRVT